MFASSVYIPSDKKKRACKASEAGTIAFKEAVSNN